MEMRSFSFHYIYLSGVIVHHVCCRRRKKEPEQRPSKINKSMNVLEKNCLINNSNSVGMFVLVYSMVSYFTSAFVFISVCQTAWIYALHIIWWYLYLLVFVWKISQSTHHMERESLFQSTLLLCFTIALVTEHYISPAFESDQICFETNCRIRVDNKYIFESHPWRWKRQHTFFNFPLAPTKKTETFSSVVQTRE